MGISCAECDRTLSLIEQSLPAGSIQDNSLLHKNLINLNPFSSKFLPSCQDELNVIVAKIALIIITGVIVIPMITYFADNIYLRENFDPLMQQTLDQISRDLERINLRIDDERVDDVQNLYERVLEAHLGDEKKTLQFLGFLHQGVIAGFLQEIFSRFNGEDLRGEQFLFLQSNCFENQERSATGLSIQVHLDQKQIFISNSQFLYEMRDFSPYRLLRRVDFNVQFDLASYEAHKVIRTVQVI